MDRSRQGFGWMLGAIALGLVAQTAQAAPIAMPAGSTVWMHFEASACPDADGDDCVGSNLPGSAPPNGIPLTTFTDVSLTHSATGFAEVLPDRVRTLNRGRYTAFMKASFQDTYTVHGTAAGSFPITVTLGATGTARSVAATETSHRLVSASVGLEIGTFNPTDVAISESSRVTPFSPATTATQSIATTILTAPFEVPVSLSTAHTQTVSVGDVFDLAYGVNSAFGNGEIDLLQTGAQISFDLPEGVWVTSALGGTWGSPPPVPVPVGPWVPIGVCAGLLALASRSLPGRRLHSSMDERSRARIVADDRTPP